MRRSSDIGRHVNYGGQGVNISRREGRDHGNTDADMTMRHDVRRNDDKAQRDEKWVDRKEAEVGKMSVSNGGVEERTRSYMCGGKEEEENEVTIAKVQINNDRKEREMERSNERKESRVVKCSVKDEFVLYQVSDGVEIATGMGIAQSVYVEVADDRGVDVIT